MTVDERVPGYLDAAKPQVTMPCIAELCFHGEENPILCGSTVTLPDCGQRVDLRYAQFGGGKERSSILDRRSAGQLPSSPVQRGEGRGVAGNLGGQVSVLGERASPLGRVLRRRLGVLMPISLGQLSHSTGPRYPYGVEVLRAARGDFQAVDDRAPEVGCHAMLTWKCGL